MWKESQRLSRIIQSSLPESQGQRWIEVKKQRRFNFAFSQYRWVFYHVVLGVMQSVVRQGRFNQSNSLLPLKGHHSEPALVSMLPLSVQTPSPNPAEKGNKTEISLVLVSCVFSQKEIGSRLSRYAKGLSTWIDQGWMGQVGKESFPSFISELFFQCTSFTCMPSQRVLTEHICTIFAESIRELWMD